MAISRVAKEDMSVQELVDEGHDAARYMPETHPNHDAFTAIALVGRRRRDLFGVHTNSQIARYGSDPASFVGFSLSPSFVVNIHIPNWRYEVDSTQTYVDSGTPVTAIERVFRVEGQRMDIDLDATVSYMKPNLVNLKEIRRILGGLEREADFENLDNQKILQEMFQRQAKNKPMLESWDFVPYHGPRRDPYRIFGISKDGTV